MLRARVIPALLLRGDGLVKSIRFRDHRYVGDPINAVRIFNEKEVDELVFLDISATHEGRKTTLDLVGRVADTVFMPLTVGGGIRTAEADQNQVPLRNKYISSARPQECGLGSLTEPLSAPIQRV